jgi:hypothetical protein
VSPSFKARATSGASCEGRGQDSGGAVTASHDGARARGQLGTVVPSTRDQRGEG